MTRRLTIVLAAALIAPMTLQMHAAEAHSMSGIPQYQATIFVAANDGVPFAPWLNQTADRTWTIWPKIGLSGGNTTQFAHFYFYVYDDGATREAARVTDVIHDWIYVNTYSWGTAITTHVGGTMDFNGVINNVDSNGQNYLVNVQATNGGLAGI